MCIRDSKAMESGQSAGVGPGSDALQYYVVTMSAAQLLELPRKPAVLEAIVMRGDVPDAPRSVALEELAQQRKVSRPALLLDMIDSVGRADARAADLGRMLAMQPPGDVKPVRDRVLKLTSDVSSPPVRSAAWATLA